jgi:hypothetical protein
MPHSVLPTVLALAGLLLLAGCSSQPVFIVDHDEQFDFGGFSTYRWYDDVHPSQQAEYRAYNSSDKRVRTYIDRELKQKQFREISSGTPDFLVEYNISRQEKMKIDNIAGYPPKGVHGGVGVGTYGSGMSIGYSSGPSVKTYKEGTVIIDVIDTASERVVWRSLAEGRLKKSLSHKEKDALASGLARELMAEFPPGG